MALVSTELQAAEPDLAVNLADEALANEQRKRKALRRMKLIPLSLLLLAAVMFAISWRVQQDPDSADFWGYVRAASEAGMVGGLADWFAVTALFRRPLGLPIPHTNLIANKKDQLGESLGEFVQTNFLTEANIRQKIASTAPAKRIGEYLEQPDHREYIVAEGSNAAVAALESVDDADVAALLKNLVMEHSSHFEWAPPLGELLDSMLAARSHDPAVDGLLRLGRDWLLANEATVTKLIADIGPAQDWAPARAIHEAVGRRVWRDVLKWAEDVNRDPDHDARKVIDEWLVTFADRLQHDPEMIANVEQLKQRILASDDSHRVLASVWPAAKQLLIRALQDPDSELRQRANEALGDFAQRLTTDEELQRRMDARIESAAAYVVNRYGGEIVTVITDQVARWDASEASRRIELQVGRDLQFIRVNGTVVGALAGLVIHFVAVNLL